MIEDPNRLLIALQERQAVMNGIICHLTDIKAKKSERITSHFYRSSITSPTALTSSRQPSFDSLGSPQGSLSLIAEDLDLAQKLHTIFTEIAEHIDPNTILKPTDASVYDFWELPEKGEEGYLLPFSSQISHPEEHRAETEAIRAEAPLVAECYLREKYEEGEKKPI